MRRFANRHSTSLFGVMALAFSLIFIPLHFLFPRAGDYAVSFTQLGPFAAVLFFSLLLPDSGLLKKVQSALKLCRATWKWAAVTAGMPAVLIGTSALVLTLTGMKSVSWSGSLLFHILNLLGIVFGALAEEIGWRGYLLPEFIVIRQGYPYFYKWGRNCRSLEKRKLFSPAYLPSRSYLLSPH